MGSRFTKIIRSNDVIFHEACMHKESTGPPEVKRITMEDDTHQGQHDGDNRPVQQQVQPDIQPNDAAVDGNNDVPDVTNDLPFDVPLVDELPEMVLQPPELQPHNMQEIPDVQPPIQGDNWVKRSTRTSKPPNRFVPTLII